MLFLFCFLKIFFTTQEGCVMGLSDLIFHEYAPVSTDVIYTEAAPLVLNGKLLLYKAGVNFFHTTAHNTANHDRRIPGGAVISINSVGHYANNLIRAGLVSDLDAHETDKY